MLYMSHAAPPYKNGLFIFRRDLRCVDNTGLNRASRMCMTVHPAFIFTPEQIGPANKYRSNNAVQFMLASLVDLLASLPHLLLFYGDNLVVVKYCIAAFNIDYVCFNMDYTPYAVSRDAKLAAMCAKFGIVCDIVPDYYLHPPRTILSATRTPYKKFTPYYKAAITRPVAVPDTYTPRNFANAAGHVGKYTCTIADMLARFVVQHTTRILCGGRAAAVRQLALVGKGQANYADTHNTLARPTSLMSAYIKFGCVSVREAYAAFRPIAALVRQLVWRDFYANILLHYPHTLGQAMKPKYNRLCWNKNSAWLAAWKTGRTGFPVVDAGMRELAATGFMHNRARLITGCFLVKTLLLDWRLGERHFAQTLVDYDVASNSGNWQWLMGGGADSQPYFRVFSPWEQSRNHDADGTYIKTWVPELRGVASKHLHRWHTACTADEYRDINYPAPICDYVVQKKKALAMYTAIFKT